MGEGDHGRACGHGRVGVPIGHLRGNERQLDLGVWTPGRGLGLETGVWA